MTALALLSRWLHMIAAMAVVGGPIFMWLALFPAAGSLADDSRRALMEAIRRRWAKVVMAAIAFLIISGMYNYILIREAAKTWGSEWESGKFYMQLYQSLFGLKVTLALAIFFIASALVGRSAGMAKFREHARYWVGVNVILALFLVLISSGLRMMHVGPNAEPAAIHQPADSDSSPAPSGRGPG